MILQKKAIRFLFLVIIVCVFFMPQNLFAGFNLNDASYNKESARVILVRGPGDRKRGYRRGDGHHRGGGERGYKVPDIGGFSTVRELPDFKSLGIEEVDVSSAEDIIVALGNLKEVCRSEVLLLAKEYVGVNNFFMQMQYNCFQYKSLELLTQSYYYSHGVEYSQLSSYFVLESYFSSLISKAVDVDLQKVNIDDFDLYYQSMVKKINSIVKKTF